MDYYILQLPYEAIQYDSTRSSQNFKILSKCNPADIMRIYFYATSRQIKKCVIQIVLPQKLPGVWQVSFSVHQVALLDAMILPN